MFELKDKPIRWRTKRRMSFLLVSHKDGSSLYMRGCFDPQDKTIYWYTEAQKGSFAGGCCRQGKLPITVCNTCGRWRSELCALIIAAVTTMFWETYLCRENKPVFVLPSEVTIPFIKSINEESFAVNEWKQVKERKPSMIK